MFYLLMILGLSSLGGLHWWQQAGLDSGQTPTGWPLPPAWWHHIQEGPLWASTPRAHGSTSHHVLLVR